MDERKWFSFHPEPEGWNWWCALFGDEVSGGAGEGVCCSSCGNEGTDCLCFLFLLVVAGGEMGCLLKFAPINGGLFALDESRG